MQGKRLRPDVMTYTILIGVRAKDDQMQPAPDLFGEMQGKAIKTDVLTYETLIKACDESAHGCRSNG